MPEEELPSFSHWVYLLDRPAQADTGRDGPPLAIPAPPDLAHRGTRDTELPSARLLLVAQTITELRVGGCS
jgi:hypothetical protein